MNGLQLGFLKITEAVEYFLPFVRAEGGQYVQDFSFAHRQSLRVGSTKDKRELSSPLARRFANPAACHLAASNLHPWPETQC